MLAEMKSPHQPVPHSYKIGLDCFFKECACTEEMPCEELTTRVCLQCSWGQDLDYLPTFLKVKWPCEGMQDAQRSL